MVFRGVECGLCPFWGVLRAYRFVWVVQYPVCTWIRLFNRLSLVQGGRFWSQKKLFCCTCSSLRFCKKIEYGITSYLLGIIQRNQTNWHAKNPNGKKPQPRPRKNHGREPPHPAPPSTEFSIENSHFSRRLVNFEPTVREQWRPLPRREQRNQKTVRTRSTISGALRERTWRHLARLCCCSSHCCALWDSAIRWVASRWAPARGRCEHRAGM